MNSSIKIYNALGLMSGTSLDGLDMAICEFRLIDEKWQFEIKHYKTRQYSESLFKRLKLAYTSSAEELAKLDADLGRFMGKEARTFLLQTSSKVDLIASHGHTVFHNPAEGFTKQIGSGADIATQSGMLTVCDFRSLDVAKGGQGAPLVPIGDKLLFSEYGACLNLGGFANISFADNSGATIAFDVCPVNFVLNRLSSRLGKEYDDGGQIARKGALNFPLLKKLNSNPYYRQEPPKSLGQEWVEENVLLLLDKETPVEDLLRTYSEHIAEQLAESINKTSSEKILITGGGSFNTYLIELLQGKCTKEIVIPLKEIVTMKEALIFAFLGVLRLRNEINTLSSVTGAASDSVSGTIYIP